VLASIQYLKKVTSLLSSLFSANIERKKKQKNLMFIKNVLKSTKILKIFNGHRLNKSQPRNTNIISNMSDEHCFLNTIFMFMLYFNCIVSAIVLCFKLRGIDITYLNLNTACLFIIFLASYVTCFYYVYLFKELHEHLKSSR
jgi:hypothetical protein